MSRECQPAFLKMSSWKCSGLLRDWKGGNDTSRVRIEYDCLVPTQLTPGLEFKGIEGLFCAGQFNGTSGYEEAAAQGIVAGINAARKVKGEPEFTLGRADGYIGVLIDDLVFKGTEEPYRILNSRAEYRLLLRHDNSDMRLTEIGRKNGLVSDERYEAFLKKKICWKNGPKDGENQSWPGGRNCSKDPCCQGRSPLKKSISLAELFRRPELTAAELAEVFPEGEGIPREIFEEVLIEIKYTGYLEKQALQVERFKRMEGKKLPRDLDYSTIKGLRVEAQEKLNALRPDSVGQASRISGVSPADISVLLIYLESLRRKEQGK